MHRDRLIRTPSLLETVVTAVCLFRPTTDALYGFSDMRETAGRLEGPGLYDAPRMRHFWRRLNSPEIN
ncbi:hypothetical protein ACFSHT_26065 [Paraburkholderia silviterrae]|uniref:Uncharacterized protein n=1 Tax=Paraburkholderia silviterrae TaxID=2528715 RepID=A0A4R5M7X9_9BURK|nr:hypothetical protein [Paraburkholderia silviterrae]TDG22374.1 hypothetical protein EYW47_18055 [Paraburkholderia silviterrae]